MSIYHIRTKTSKGGLTFVTTYDVHSNTTLVNLSICSPDDQFCKKTGIRNSASKFLIIPSKILSSEHVINTFLQSSNILSVNRALNSLSHNFFGISHKKLLTHFGGLVDPDLDMHELLKLSMKKAEYNNRQLSNHEISYLFSFAKFL